MLPGQCLVHAADSAELAAHGAGIIMLRGTVSTDSLGSLRIQGALPLGIPVQLAAGIPHPVIDFPGAPDSLGNISRMGCNSSRNGPERHALHRQSAVSLKIRQFC